MVPALASSVRAAYDGKVQRIAERVINGALRGVFRVIARIDAREMRKLPRRGPGIIITNHTTNLEGPAEYLFMQPRHATALGKRELWDRWYTRMFMRLWGVIPLRRGEVDTRAVKQALRALDRGVYLGIAPEGTRSKNGVMRRGLPGIAVIATRKPVPIYPVAQTGFLTMGAKLRQFRRPSIVFRIGRPFTVRLPAGQRLTAPLMREITDEIMFELARLLPRASRGPYATAPEGAPRYLEYTT